MTKERHFDIPDHVLTRQIDAETIILDMNRSVYCGLDDVGTRFLKLIQENKPLSEVLTCLYDEYDVPKLELENDIKDFVADLLEKNLIIERG